MDLMIYLIQIDLALTQRALVTTISLLIYYFKGPVVDVFPISKLTSHARHIKFLPLMMFL